MRTIFYLITFVIACMVLAVAGLVVVHRLPEPIRPILEQLKKEVAVRRGAGVKE